MSTTTADITLQQILNNANLNQLAAALSKVKLGNVLGSVKVTVASLGATATPQITGSAVRAAATISGLDRGTNDNLPAIQTVKTLRVTTSGTAQSVGSYVVSDASGTAVSPTAGANVGLALLSDDGTTLTFPTMVTGFVIEYTPRPDTALSTLWASGV